MNVPKSFLYVHVLLTHFDFKGCFLPSPAQDGTSGWVTCPKASLLPCLHRMPSADWLNIYWAALSVAVFTNLCLFMPWLCITHAPFLCKVVDLDPFCRGCLPPYSVLFHDDLNLGVFLLTSHHYLNACLIKGCLRTKSLSCAWKVSKRFTSR